MQNLGLKKPIHHHHQFYFRHLAHIHLKTYSKTHTKNTQIMQIQVKLNKNSTISTVSYTHLTLPTNREV